jgi:ABC-type xylose transport system permease subunit
MSDNEIKRKPIQVKGEEIEQGEVSLLLPGYTINEHEYNLLVSSNTGFNDWSKSFLLISLGWIVKILSVVILFFWLYYEADPEKRFNINPDLKTWEFISVVVALFMWLILFLFGCVIKSEKDNLKKDIKKYYQDRKLKR